MNAFWKSREPRERLLMIAAGVLLALVILVQFVTMPILRARADARAEYQTASRTHGVVLDLLERQRAGQGGGAVAPNSMLGLDDMRNLLVSEARARGLSVTQIRTLGDGGMAVVLDKVPSTEMFGWLLKLETEHGLIPGRVTMTAGADGIVQASLEFSSAGP